MKRYARLLLTMLNAALVLALAAQWFTAQGELRNAHWQPPEAQKTDFSAMLPVLPAAAPADAGNLIGMLDRPLFSPTRRPPPPPPPPEAAPPQDNLSTARLMGIYQGDQAGGGIIISIGGKTRRVRLDGDLDGWKLQAIQGRSVTFARTGQTRVLQLARASMAGDASVPGQPAVSSTSSARIAAGRRAVSPPPPVQAPLAQPADSRPRAAPAPGAASAAPKAVFGGNR